MNRKLVSGTVAALAAVALATGGGTFAAFDQAADVAHNKVSAGVLRLDLSGGASASTTLSFAGLLPGQTERQRLWVAANDARSVGPAELTVTVRDLVDTAAPCSLNTGKAEGEIASGIAGCTISGGRVTGTPSTGVLSRLLDVRAIYDPTAADSQHCGSSTLDAATARSIFPGGAGSLHAAATANNGTGTTAVIGTAHGPLAVAPGEGVCIFVSAYFPPGTTAAADASPAHPLDNAAQGDSLRVAVGFQLTQVAS